MGSMSVGVKSKSHFTPLRMADEFEDYSSSTVHVIGTTSASGDKYNVLHLFGEHILLLSVQSGFPLRVTLVVSCKP